VWSGTSDLKLLKIISFLKTFHIFVNLIFIKQKQKQMPTITNQPFARTLNKKKSLFFTTPSKREIFYF